ncbi:hypothetical protein B1813_11445 [Saccharomonospora piscinae]|uniref:Uncharacterized protein n=1 Tax=Saccharomonospora piscinae TaxID=687388 RepID=A0A1V9A6S4_SACPI|nr:hypothetical protein [Saccharomonospora piscinae]OQO92760.1 hypothetical protein B1813_11445 [Saccharomonospora piscinae]
MSDGKKQVGDEDEKKSGLAPAQVTAAALAAVTAAFLGSTLGVYGTVLGAGLISVVTTVGSEFFMRSLERTRAAARVLPGVRRRGPHGEQGAEASDPHRTVYLPAPTRQQWAEHNAAVERTRVLSSTGREADAKERSQWWRRRGPVVAATSALAFVIGMLAVTGYEGVTGKALSGGGDTTVSSIVRGEAGFGGGQQGRDDTGDGRDGDQDGGQDGDADPGAPADPTGSPTSPVPSTSPADEPDERPAEEEPTETPEPTRSEPVDEPTTTQPEEPEPTVPGGDGEQPGSQP